MFVGHYSASIVAKTISPNTPFWILVLAAQLVDVFWAIFIYYGIERVEIDHSLPSSVLNLYYMPFTHSLVAMLFWSCLAFMVVRFTSRIKLSVQASLVVALVVASHWLLDFFVHRPDLVIYKDIKVGLGLWNYPIISLVLELSLLAICTLIFCWKSELNNQHKLYMGLFFLVLLTIQFASIFLAAPTTVPMVSSLALVVFIGLTIAVFFAERRLSR